ncbi:hypothetical protein LJC46_00295, partial [Desulfovibrio sp. OttesenSCG-928-G15]|nr:hypothetical protein [Desulfovibrio sp. OttesenSCG-928-G15]
MKKRVKQVFRAGTARHLATAAFALLFSGTALAGSVHWEKLQDRERVTFNLSDNEAMSGEIGRVAPTGVIIPFGRVPAGVDIPLPPNGAQIVKGTKHFGQALVLETHTPEFGFVVTKHTPTQIIIDFFHNVLGARWKPSTVAPTSEVAPDLFVQPGSTPTPEVTVLQKDPQGASLATHSLKEEQKNTKERDGEAKDAKTSAPVPKADAAAAPDTKPDTKPEAKPDAAKPQEGSAAVKKTVGEPAPAPTPSPAPTGGDSPAPRTSAPSAPAAPVTVPSGDSSAGADPLGEAIKLSADEGENLKEGVAPENQMPQVVPPESVTSGVISLPSSSTPPVPSVLDLRGQAAEMAEPLAMPDIIGIGTPNVSGLVSPDTSAYASSAQQGAANAQAPSPASADAKQEPTSPDTNSSGEASSPAPPPVTPDAASPATPDAAPDAAPGAAPGTASDAVHSALPPHLPFSAEEVLAPGLGIETSPGIFSGIIAGLESPAPAAVPGDAAAVADLPAPAKAPEDSSEKKPEAPAEQAPVLADAEQGMAAPGTPEPAVSPIDATAPEVSGQVVAAVQDAGGGAAVPPSSDSGPLPGDAEKKTEIPVEQAGVDKATGSEGKASEAKEGEAEAPPVQLDAEGNPIVPPPSPEEILAAMKKAMGANDYPAANAIGDQLLATPDLTPAQREEGLHLKAEALFAMNKDALVENYRDIADATLKAINFNTKSPRNAGALLRLGYLNLKASQLAEADARFNMLRKQFPNDENVPLTYYYWGEYYFGRNEMQKSADEFQYILQHYSTSKYAREAALGLARSFYRLGYYDQAYDVVDYIGRRWENFYLDYPPFLNMMGDIAFRLNKLDEALKHYWLYINLEPTGEETDIILARLGDIYTMKRERGAAKQMYNMCMERFPDKDGALVSMMRLAEESVNDDPSIVGMFHIFDTPSKNAPSEVYRNIITQHPQSALVPLAQLKLSLWYLWQKDYVLALDNISDFLSTYPQHELAPKAREIVLQSFSLLATDCMKDQNYARMRDVWDRFPMVREQIDSLAPDSRVALAMSLNQENRPNEALKILEPFFLGNKAPGYSEMALQLALSIYLEYGQWSSVMEVARQVDMWELTEDTEQQLDYAVALAAENLGDSETATPLLKKLFESNKLPQNQMTYATFFYARSAERMQDYTTAFFAGQTALNRLLELVEKNPNAADMGKIESQLSSLIDIAEKTGRLREALVFAERALQYIGANDPARSAVMYRMARIYKKQGSEDGWRKTLQDIVARADGSVYAKLAESELNAST